MMFQMTFAIITPALIAGAFADRMKFSALCIFMTLWSLLIYAPIAHWVWSPTGWGAINWACSTSPAAPWCTSTPASPAWCAALVLGKRVGYGTDNMAPYNLAYAVIGASLLWVGWFGFNAGSAVGANGRAGMAMAVTQIATAAAALAWMFAEWIAKGKPSVLGAAPARSPGWWRSPRPRASCCRAPSIIIGIAAGVVCFWCCHQPEAHVRLRRQPGLLRRARHRRHHRRAADRRVRLRAAVGNRCQPGRQPGRPGAVWIQCQGVAATLVYSGVGTLVLLYSPRRWSACGSTRRKSARVSTSCCTANRCSERLLGRTEESGPFALLTVSAHHRR